MQALDSGVIDQVFALTTREFIDDCRMSPATKLVRFWMVTKQQANPSESIGGLDSFARQNLLCQPGKCD